MSRVPNVSRSTSPISERAARSIASIVARDRQAVTGISLDVDALTAAVLADLKGWKRVGFCDDGRKAVLAAFEKHVEQMEEALHV